MLRAQGGQPTRIGRAEGNDLVLSDQTVSRHHCELTHDTSGWSLTCCAEAHAAVVVQGTSVAPGQTVSLAAGVTLELGNVKLTFASAWGMAKRLSRRE